MASDAGSSISSKRLSPSQAASKGADRALQLKTAKLSIASDEKKAKERAAAEERRAAKQKGGLQLRKRELKQKFHWGEETGSGGEKDAGDP